MKKTIFISLLVLIIVFSTSGCAGKRIDKSFCGMWHTSVSETHAYGTKNESKTYNLKEDGFYELTLRTVDCGYETFKNTMTGEWYRSGDYIYLDSNKVFKIVNNSLVLIGNTTLEVKKIDN